MAFRVRLTPEVADDAEKLYWRTIEEAPLRGQEWYSGLIAAIDSLNSNPLRCPMAPDRALREFEVRYLLYGRRSHDRTRTKVGQAGSYDVEVFSGL